MEYAVVDFDEDLGTVTLACLSEGVPKDELVTTILDLFHYTDYKEMMDLTGGDVEVCRATDRLFHRLNSEGLVQAMEESRFFILNSYGLFMFLETSDERNQDQSVNGRIEYQPTFSGGLSGESNGPTGNGSWRMLT